jgi:4-hydroxy-tetrahydrodipicolinate synthase
MAGVKEAIKDITKITNICRECKDFSVWSGNDDLIVPAISLGANGVISVLSNLMPTETKAMADAALDGDLDTATSLQQLLQPVIELLFCESNPIPVKSALKLIGYDCGRCRLPLSDLSVDHLQQLKSLLK